MAARAKEPAPPVRLDQLRASLEEKGLARGYVIRGEEPWFRERAIELLKARAERDGYEVRLHDGEPSSHDFQLSSVIDDLAGGGLFASRRLVVVRNPGAYLKKVEDGPSPLTRAVTRYLGAEEEGGCVVLCAASLRADLVAVKAIQKAGGETLTLRRLYDSAPAWNPDPRRAELVEWFVRRAHERGVKLDASQAVYVCAATGNDLAGLEDQIERLRRSSGRELREVVGWNAATAPWTVADHVVGGDLARALAGVETLFGGGFQEKGGRRLLDAVALGNMLLSSVVKAVRQGLALAQELERGVEPAAALRTLGVRGAPRTTQAAVERARLRSARVWRSMLEDLVDLERRAKSSSSLDASDFVALALRWARTAPTRAVSPRGGAG